MRAIAAFAMLAALSACASAPPAAGPLKAELTEDELGARVSLTAPAYVALFRITPGVGTTLIYPRDQADRPQVRAGNTVLVARTSTRGASALGVRGSTYLYLVASKDPLEVEQFQTGDRDVREVIGGENATSHDLQVVMSSLEVALMSTDATVAGPWTSDVLTPWERLASRGTDSRGGAREGRSMGFGEAGCRGTWASGHCRGVQPTPEERRAGRPGSGGGGGTSGGGGKPGGTGSTGNN